MIKVFVMAKNKKEFDNWVREQDIGLHVISRKITFVSNPEQVKGHRNFYYVVVSYENVRKLERFLQEIRSRDGNELSLDINDWPVSVFA